VSQLIVSVLDYDQIGKLLMDTVVDTMKVRHCSLFLKNTSGPGFINFSTRGEPIDPGCSILINDHTCVIEFMARDAGCAQRYGRVGRGNHFSHDL
ncbi:MAG: hypothetical protein JRF62_14935, partial [Deltaproteobacteria bacterium]|nr:hypothetical protein [Deltaproteobacteria bacterium]